MWTFAVTPLRGAGYFDVAQLVAKFRNLRGADVAEDGAVEEKGDEIGAVGERHFAWDHPLASLKTQLKIQTSETQRVLTARRSMGALSAGVTTQGAAR
jgi:hypothetical protein